MHRTTRGRRNRYRWVARIVVLALLATVLAVTPVVQQTERAGAEAAPVMGPVDGCVTPTWAAVPDCGGGAFSVSGAFDGQGSVVSVTITPDAAPCSTGDGAGNFEPDGCFDRYGFSPTSGTSSVFVDCFTLDHDDGVPKMLVGCDFLYDDGGLASPPLDAQRPGGGACEGAGDFDTYVEGGPSNEPDGPWAARAEQYYTCEFTWNSLRPDHLSGPSWVLVRVGSQPVLIPIAGDLYNNGVDADFAIVETDTPGTYDFDNLSRHNHPRYFEVTQNDWFVEDEFVASAQNLRYTFDIPGFYDVRLLVGDEDGNQDARVREVHVPASVLQVSMVVDTELGDNVATVGEEFPLILVLRLSDDGVGDVRDITMTEDPFRFTGALFDVVAQPADTGPFDLAPGETKELRWSLKALRTTGEYFMRASFSAVRSTKSRTSYCIDCSAAFGTPIVRGPIIEGDTTTTTSTTTTSTTTTSTTTTSTTTTTLPPSTTTTTTTTTVPPPTSTTTTTTTPTVLPPSIIAPGDDGNGPDDDGEMAELDECSADLDDTDSGDPPESVHGHAVDCLTMWGITDDAPEAYIPTDPVTRGQLATYLARLAIALGYELPTGPDAFDDDDGNIHEAAINQLAALDILRGDDGLVSADGAVTRGQMATILVRLWTVLTGETLAVGADAFTDDDGNPHEDAINALAAAGITTGTGDGYEPDSPVRGDQMASFLARLIERLNAD